MEMNPRPWWTMTTTRPAAGKTQNGTSTAACNSNCTTGSHYNQPKHAASPNYHDFIGNIYATNCILASIVSDIIGTASCSFAETLTRLAICSLNQADIIENYSDEIFLDLLYY